MESQGVIFDFNGTMFYDEKFQEKAWRTYLEEKIGREVSEEEFQKYIHGRNAEATFHYFLKRECSRKEVEMLEEEKEIVYRKLCLENPEEFHLAAGLPEFLDELKNESVPFTIATASGLNNVKFFFEHLQLGRWFDLERVIYNDGTIPGKPEPDIYLRAANMLGVAMKKCAVFEDTSSGINAAYRAGAEKIIGVASMLKEENLLSFTGVTAVIKNYQNLEKLLSSI